MKIFNNIMPTTHIMQVAEYVVHNYSPVITILITPFQERSFVAPIMALALWRKSTLGM
jgi:hypothetical protein